MAENKPEPVHDTVEDAAPAAAPALDTPTLPPPAEPSAKGAPAVAGKSAPPAPPRPAAQESTGAPVLGDLPDAPVTPEQPGRYQLKRETGAGGQGVVNLVHDAVIGRDVALKVLLDEKAAQGRFLREARITGQLEHPSIVPVHELGRRKDGAIYYTQKFIRGRTLRAALRACESPEERLRLLPHFIDVCQAIAYAHGRGVVHRDLKPDNVMVGEFGETVVLDWGLAKVLGGSAPDPVTRPPRDNATSPDLFFSNAPEDGDTPKTREGAVFGTPSYMSPEQAQGRLAEIDQLSDIWTLGAMLYELLCGRAPFARPGKPTDLRRVARGKIPALPQEAPPELSAVAMRALQKDRALRYQSAAALAAEVEAFTLGSRVGAYDYSPWELFRKLVAKNPVAAAATAAALLVLLGAVIFISRAHRAAVSALAETLTLQAASLEKDQLWGQAAALYAAARAQEDRPDARLGEAFAYKLALQPQTRLATGAPALAVAFANGELVATTHDGSLWLGGRKLAAHGGPAWALATSGAQVATGGADGRVRLWNPPGELPLTPVPVRAERSSEDGGEGAPTGGIAALAYSPDGKLLASASLERGVELWQGTARVAHVEGAAFGVALSADRLATAGADGVIRLFTLQGEQVAEQAAHTGRARSVAISPDAALVASGGQDNRVVLWRPGSTEPPRKLEGHLRAVTAVRFSTDGALLASSSRDGLFILWDAATGRPLSRIDAGERAADGLAFGNGLLAVAFQDDVARTWALPVERRILGAAGDTDQIRAVAFSPDGTRFASAAQDGAIRIRDRATAREQLLLRSASSKLRALAWGAAGLAAGGDGDVLELWDGAGRPLQKLPSGSVGALAFSPQGLLASGGRKGELMLWRDGALLAQVQTGHPAVESVAFHGALLATSGNDGHVRIWEVPALTLRKDLHAHGEAGRGVAFSPDGALLASGGSDRRLVLYETAGWTQVRELEGHKGRVHGVVFSPDGKWLASSCSDRSVRLFDARTFALLWSSARHDGPVLDLAFSPDGLALVTAGADRTLELLRFDGLAEPAPLDEVLRTLGLHFAGQRLQ